MFEIKRWSLGALLYDSLRSERRLVSGPCCMMRYAAKDEVSGPCCMIRYAAKGAWSRGLAVWYVTQRKALRTKMIRLKSDTKIRVESDGMYGIVKWGATGTRNRPGVVVWWGLGSVFPPFLIARFSCTVQSTLGNTVLYLWTGRMGWDGCLCLSPVAVVHRSRGVLSGWLWWHGSARLSCPDVLGVGDSQSVTSFLSYAC